MIHANSNAISDPSHIPAWACGFISSDDLRVVEDAVRQAERQTSGEIVPLIVHSSTKLILPRLVLFFATMFLVVALQILGTEFLASNILYALEIGLTCVFALGSFFAPLPNFLLRAVMPERDMARLVDLRAELEFYRCRMQNTKAKTGILLMVSYAEHRAVVLADQSISSKLPPNTWDEVLGLILHGLKNKNVGDGLSKAIAKCGDVLAIHFPGQHDDVDELKNHLIIKE